MGVKISCLRIPRQFVSTAVKNLCAIAHKNGRWDGSGAICFNSRQKFVYKCPQKWQVGRFRGNLFQLPSKICVQVPTKMAGGTVPGHWVSVALKKVSAMALIFS